MPPTLFLHLPLPPTPFFPLFPLILEKFPLPSESPPSSLRRGAKIKNIRGAGVPVLTEKPKQGKQAPKKQGFVGKKGIGCTPKGAYGNTAFREGFWEGSGKGSGEGVLRRVLRRGSSMSLTVKKGSEKASQKGFWEGGFQKVPRTPPCRVRPLRRAP